MRKAMLAYTSTLLLSPLSGWALGLGDVDVNSRLNQPLNAKIELHSVTNKELEQLRVTLAPKNVYLQTGIERSEYLSRLSFNVIQRNGKNYVSITTEKPFKVPFANFLIEASWESGHLFREYTILLDPPEFIAKHTRQATTAKLTSNLSSAKETPIIKINKSNEPGIDTFQHESNTDHTPANNNSAELSSGIIKQNDTLWHIAKRMAPEGVSVDQVMMALSPYVNIPVA
ncbi:MAG: hypothetical protein KZQ64_01285 [gamma proteobacterium symbiont of Bathyaustriella thionipta]|nr:hypothetical protein [gamma proteobacterium symbiont of Bathyaustriella thionipta]MCU7950255.1 hypothetical protein [gamma proteobacterium symbiont of Bathyaustriella thionipta]MCU7952033.1 hypothetical protein [gamma proteobacterium symbiont of Bathyaustriella thionipta]MCU7957706.1 hypothetical protein [gamma proteobacterium symbiont of Bathyaustriella thionipta]MCU7967237.1 hypothetical protein [gamma proteobacterium symbiont of Bathyaustriella thionipta]